MGFQVPAVFIGAAQTQIGCMPKDQQRLHKEFLDKELTLQNKLGYVSGLDFEVDRVARKIEAVTTQIRRLETNKCSGLNRVMYGIETGFTAIGCVVSWVIGIGVLFLSTMGVGPLTKEEVENDFFREPVNICQHLFRKTVYSADAWKKVMLELEDDHRALQTDIVKLHKRDIKPLVTALNDQKSHIVVPTMQHDLTSLLDSVAKVEKKYQMNEPA